MSSKGGPLEAEALLKHVQALEDELPAAESSSFGHPEPPKLFMCKIPHPDKMHADYGVIAMIAVTKRCVSAQLFREGHVAISEPVEVLVLPSSSDDDDKITASTLFALEVPELSAEDTLIVQDQGKNSGSGVVSLMKGGIKNIAPAPRVAVVIGTAQNRVVSVEFSVKLKTLQLVRRNHMVGKQSYSYFEPMPLEQLTKEQKEKAKRPSAAPQRRSSYDSLPGEATYKRRKGPIVPFEPTGGVKSITPYSLGAEREKTHVWIAFGDATLVRAHHAGFFPSVIQKHNDSGTSPPPLEKILDDELVRCQARLPNLPETEVTVIPLPKYHPSPLAPFPSLSKPKTDEEDDGPPDALPTDEVVVPDVFEAMLFCKGAMANAFPAVSFYTSEDHLEGRMYGDLDEKKADDDGNIIGAVVGGILGLFGGGNKGGEKRVERQVASEEEDPEEWDPRIPFPSINYDAIPLYAGYEIHDSPRQVTFVTVDPEGDLAAVADTLGRITLVDLTTKQVIRMWKGFRDSSCYWLQVPHENKEKPWARTKILYLVIHSRQRRVVEVWRTRHGPKVKSLQVGREAQVMSCREMSSVGFISTCYLAHSNTPGSSMNQIERISIEESPEAEDEARMKSRPVKRSDAVRLSQDAAVRLNHLKQLLGDTNVECRSVDVFKALENIKSIKDLATAMDIIAEASTLEEKMGVKGSEFQRLVIAHCKDRFDEAVRDGGEEAVTNPHVQLLAFKIAYFTQVRFVRCFIVVYRDDCPAASVGFLTRVCF